MSDWDMRFGGVQRLYGQENFKKIQASHIAVIGVGGVGSWSVEALARTGVGQLTLVDFDDVCISNTNRQLPALSNTVGRLKTEVLKERALLINPEIQVNIINSPFEKSTESEIFSQKYDGVVDAIDHGLTKYDLVLACKERNIPLVMSGSAGGRLDPSQIKTADLSQSKEDPMLASIRKRLRQKANFPRKGSMGLPCVYTTEKARYSDSEGCVTQDRPEEFNKPLDCATGFGTTTPVTGSFGFFLSHLIVKVILSS